MTWHIWASITETTTTFISCEFASPGGKLMLELTGYEKRKRWRSRRRSESESESERERERETRFRVAYVQIMQSKSLCTILSLLSHLYVEHCNPNSFLTHTHSHSRWNLVSGSTNGTRLWARRWSCPNSKREMIEWVCSSVYLPFVFLLGRLKRFTKKQQLKLELHNILILC